MSVPAAYLGVVLIWGTTPLAIKWSGEGVGYLFGVTGRMVIGVVLALVLVYLMRLQVWIGTLLIMTGLLGFELDSRWLRRWRAA